MISYQGKNYNDDRLFILDLTQAKKGNRIIWAVVTRHNYQGFPPFQIDEFDSKEDAVSFIMKTESSMPRISLGGDSPQIPISYEANCQLLESEGIPSSLEIYELNKGNKREIILEALQEEKRPNPPPTPPKRFLYNFAHVALPILALGNPKKFYSDISGSGGKQYLLTMWNGLERRMGARESNDGLNLTKSDLRSDIQVFVIHMPKATNVPEAIYIGIAFRVKKQFLKTEVYSGRYFTLELGKNSDTNSNEYHFCEWVGAINSQHKNYGQLPNANENTFLWAIDRAIE
jgi:hypothetical protein